MEIENDCLANTTVITVAGKNHWWMLKFMDQSMMRKRYLRSENISHKILINCKGKNSSFTGTYLVNSFNQVIKLHLTYNKIWPYVPPDMTHWDRHSVHNFNLPLRKYWTIPKRGVFCKMNGQTLLKCQGQKDWGTVLGWSIKEAWHLNVMWLLGLDPGPEKGL